MSNPREQQSASGRDVEAAVRDILRGAAEPGGRAAPEERARPQAAPAPGYGTAAPGYAAASGSSEATGGNGTTTAPGGGASGSTPRLAGPLEAFLRHPILTLLPVILLVGAAILIGTQREAEHTAEARIQVGRDNVPPFYLQQVVSGSQALAATYARAVYAEPVIQAAARGAGVPVQEVRGKLDGTQVGGSTLIEIEARSDSEQTAIRLANSAATAMVDYVVDLTRDTDQSARLFDQYRKAQRRFHAADARVRRLIPRERRRPAQLRQARLDADVAKLRAEDLAARYRQSTAEVMTASDLEVIAPAATTTSDREDTLQTLLVIGAIAGLVLGLGLALVRSNWSLLRAVRRG
ncbi:MAG TPA: hypothetical protein VF715_04170 [Thermoleophilaceae bacterium]